MVGLTESLLPGGNTALCDFLQPNEVLCPARRQGSVAAPGPSLNELRAC